MRPVDLQRRLVLAAGLLLGAQMVSAGEQPLSVVALRYLVPGHSPERIEAALTIPLEKTLGELPRVSEIWSNTGEGFVVVDIHIEGGATQHDVETVERHVEKLTFAPDIVITSRTTVLAPRSQ